MFLRINSGPFHLDQNFSQTLLNEKSLHCRRGNAAGTEEPNTVVTEVRSTKTTENDQLRLLHFA